MARKYFTPEAANRTLPLVRRIVQDIVTDYGRWKAALARYEVAAAGQRPEHGESPEAVALRRAVDEVAQGINGYIAELERIGCVLKGFDDGLVDFRSTIDGRDVWLCWKLGEPEVAHWHALDQGYQSRQPLHRQLAGDSLDR
jgi:hypothetical protein